MSGPTRIAAWQCARGHTSLHPDQACTACGGRLRTLEIAPDATLLFATTVRVNPSGQPFQLGVAVTRCGRARTLCRIEGALRGLGHDVVVLERRGDVIVARRRSRA